MGQGTPGLRASGPTRAGPTQPFLLAMEKRKVIELFLGVKKLTVWGLWGLPSFLWASLLGTYHMAMELQQTTSSQWEMGYSRGADCRAGRGQGSLPRVTEGGDEDSREPGGAGSRLRKVIAGSQ